MKNSKLDAIFIAFGIYFICLTIVLFPDSPAPLNEQLKPILRDKFIRNGKIF